MSTPADVASFEQLLEHLRQSRGFDFTAYKRSSLMRRVVKRMHVVEVPTFDAYIDYLQLHPDEFLPLFNTILINVTSFFRDPELWSYVESDILPQLLEGRPAEPLRIWSAGCASGEEAYSIAMLLAERVGIEHVHDAAKIYATDVDDDALAEARRATFHLKDLAGLPPGFADKYFTVEGHRAVFNRDLRRAVMFGRIDLLQDAPISRIDLLLCRNTLMYFNADAQRRILSRFSFSLNPDGFLVLGRAEMLFNHTGMFVPADLPRRVFRAVVRANNRDRIGPLGTGRDDMANGASSQMRLRQAAFDADPNPQLVLDALGVLVSATAGARQQFGIRSADIGRPLQELEVSHRPADLRSAIDRATTERQEVILKDVQQFGTRHPRYYDVTVGPIYGEQQTPVGVRIQFTDCTALHLLQAELSASKQELQGAYEELQSTNEELETTNEELQSTVEELETTNEELQSTNEELETMNEELQSTNEELQTINDELRTRTMDADILNGYLASVFSSLRAGVVVIDQDYQVRVWNRRSEDLWGISADEAVGALFLDLDIGLPVAELGQPIREVMTGQRPTIEMTVTATTRKGKLIDCRVTVTPLAIAEGGSPGVILLMEESTGGMQPRTTFP